MDIRYRTCQSQNFRIEITDIKFTYKNTIKILKNEQLLHFP